MKILFIGISGYQYPHTRVRCYHFAKELAKRGFNTEVLSFKDHLAPEKTEVQMYGLRDREKIKLSIKAFIKLLKKRKTVFVLQKLHYHSAIPYLFKRMKLNPFIFDLDDWDEYCLALFNHQFLNKLFFKSNSYKDIVFNMAKSAPFTIAASHKLQEILSKANPNTYLVPTVVDVEKFPYYERPLKEPVNFLWTGIIWGETVYKSMVSLVKAFSIAYNSFKNIQLTIIGGGQLMDKFKKYTYSNYPNLPVKFIGWVDPNKMPEYIKQADVGLLPLFPIPEDVLWAQCKSPTKLYEFMASGMANISSNIGEAIYLLKDYETGFLANSIEDFAEKILILAKNYNLRKQLGFNASKFIRENYSLQVIGNILEEIFSPFK